MRKGLVAWLAGWALFSLPWTTFTPHPQLARVNSIPFRARPLDQILNLTYYVPLGSLAVAAGYAPAAVAGAGIVLSATAEVIQIFSTDRYPSTTDVILNTTGTLLGAGLALAARRRSQSI
jgi:VanZ family protein